MKRECNRSGHAAVSFGKPFKARNRLWVTNDASDGFTLCRVFGLALCAGLGRGHSSERRSVNDANRGDVFAAVFGNGFTRNGFGLLRGICRNVIDDLIERGSVVRALNGAMDTELHGCLRVEPISTMCLDYIVTSDMSIGQDNIFLNATHGLEQSA